MATTSKQDRQGARTTADLERKYKFGKTFSEVMGIATDSQRAAEKAASAVGDIDKKLNPTEIFNILTNNGQLQGIYKGDDGEIYINASFLVTGVIKSPDGSITIDLDNGTASIKTSTETVDGKEVYSSVRPSTVSVTTVDDGTTSMLCNDGVVTNTPKSYYRVYASPIFDKAGFLFVVGDDEGVLEAEVTKERISINGLTAPIHDADAVNKAYVDALEARVAALEAAINS